MNNIPSSGCHEAAENVCMLARCVLKINASNSQSEEVRAFRHSGSGCAPVPEKMTASCHLRIHLNRLRQREGSSCPGQRASALSYLPVTHSQPRVPHLRSIETSTVDPPWKLQLREPLCLMHACSF